MNEINEKFMADESAMLKLGKQLATACDQMIRKTNQPIVIYLFGQLGAGKTTLTRGFLQSLGYSHYVKSPTYTLVESYDLNVYQVLHFDLYRIHDPMELELIGIQDYFAENTISLIEWPTNGEAFLPIADLSCYIEMEATGRKIKLIGNTDQGQAILRQCLNEE